jgi:hypothetical protein
MTITITHTVINCLSVTITASVPAAETAYYTNRTYIWAQTSTSSNNALKTSLSTFLATLSNQLTITIPISYFEPSVTYTFTLTYKDVYDQNLVANYVFGNLKFPYPVMAAQSPFTNIKRFVDNVVSQQVTASADSSSSSGFTSVWRLTAGPQIVFNSAYNTITIGQCVLSRS